MSKLRPLYIFAAHAKGPSSMKLLWNSLTNLGLHTELSLYVKCNEPDNFGELLTFELHVMPAKNNDNIELNEQQNQLKALLPFLLDEDENLVLDKDGKSISKKMNKKELFDLIDTIKKLPFVDSNHIELYLDANLGNAAGEHVTELAHEMSHRVRPQFLYPFSDTPVCRVEANHYVTGVTTPQYIDSNGDILGGLKLDLKLKDGFSDSKSNLAARKKTWKSAVKTYIDNLISGSCVSYGLTFFQNHRQDGVRSKVVPSSTATPLMTPFGSADYLDGESADASPEFVIRKKYKREEPLLNAMIKHSISLSPHKKSPRQKIYTDDVIQNNSFDSSLSCESDDFSSPEFVIRKKHKNDESALNARMEPNIGLSPRSMFYYSEQSMIKCHSVEDSPSEESCAAIIP